MIEASFDACIGTACYPFYVNDEGISLAHSNPKLLKFEDAFIGFV